MYVLISRFLRPFKPTPVALAGPCLHPAWDQPQRGNRHTLAEQRVR
jgi:hypothetical protein